MCAIKKWTTTQRMVSEKNAQVLIDYINKYILSNILLNCGFLNSDVWDLKTFALK